MSLACKELTQAHAMVVVSRGHVESVLTVDVYHLI